ncbi:MAG: hypothetical protein Q8R96_11700 [Bacteroidota bacterium]|nr:hypothetical protein [Bacteroidota bacterium]
MKITFSENIGSTPAIVRRDTGEIFLNRKIWFNLPQAYRRFILYHEMGHYTLQTTNELEADHYAFNQIAGTQKESLKNTVRTLYGVLPFNTELQGLRLLNMYRLALTYDQKKTPTAARQTEIRRIENDILKNYSQNQQFQEYMYSTKGKTTDYEFPGYDNSQFNPSIGLRFRDVLINSSANTPGTNTPWPTNQTQFVPKYTAPVQTAQTEAKPLTVPLDLVPDYKTPFRIDWQGIATGILVLLAIMGLKKL